jgi:hypothetical protein
LLYELIAAYALYGILCRATYTSWMCVRYDFARVAALQWFKDHSIRGLLHEVILAVVFGGLRSTLWVIGFLSFMLSRLAAWSSAHLILMESKL